MKRDRRLNTPEAEDATAEAVAENAAASVVAAAAAVAEDVAAIKL